MKTLITKISVIVLMLMFSFNLSAKEIGFIENHSKLVPKQVTQMQKYINEMIKIQTNIGLTEEDSHGRLSAIGQLIMVATDIYNKVENSWDQATIKSAHKQVRNILVQVKQIETVEITEIEE